MHPPLLPRVHPPCTIGPKKKETAPETESAYVSVQDVKRNGAGNKKHASLARLAHGPGIVFGS
jgi:hypothetical protein